MNKTTGSIFRPNYLVLALLLFVSPFAVSAQISGCTDPASLNYNPAATISDGSCAYEQATVFPTYSVVLAEALPETSGLIFWNDQLLTHNDNDDTFLYALDETNGNILESIELPGVTNEDWEAVSQDEMYIYIGDFGNNADGNREDLKIYRINKNSLFAGTPQVDVINFSYENQHDFSVQLPNATDFDCEAFIVSSDSIYLFTKQWQSNNTVIYSLPKVPGDHIAHPIGALTTNGMVTDATYLEEEKLIVLSGYSSLLQPFLFLVYDFEGEIFLSGNKRKLNLGLPFHQIEGIATQNGKEYFLTNEYFKPNAFVEIQQQLHKVDLSAFLEPYLATLETEIFEENKSELSVYPNPANETVHIKSEMHLEGADYLLFNEIGQQVQQGTVKANNSISLSELAAGLYFLKLMGTTGETLKVAKK